MGRGQDFLPAGFLLLLVSTFRLAAFRARLLVTSL